MIENQLFYTEPIPNTAHGLQPDRIGRIALDLAAQPVDLDVDGALADFRIVADKLVAGYRLTCPRREDRQDLLLAVGQLQRLAATLQFAPGNLERVGTEDQLLDLGRGRRAATAQDVVDAQDQLARIERFWQIVVGAGLKSADAAVGLRRLLAVGVAAPLWR